MSKRRRLIGADLEDEGDFEDSESSESESKEVDDEEKEPDDPEKRKLYDVALVWILPTKF